MKLRPAKSNFNDEQENTKELKGYRHVWRTIDALGIILLRRVEGMIATTSGMIATMWNERDVDKTRADKGRAFHWASLSRLLPRNFGIKFNLWANRNQHLKKKDKGTEEQIFFFCSSRLKKEPRGSHEVNPADLSTWERTDYFFLY